MSKVLNDLYRKNNNIKDYSYPSGYYYYESPCNFIKERQLPEDFYPYFTCKNNNLFKIFKKVDEYITVEDKYQNKIRNCPNFSNIEEKTKKEEIIQIITNKFNKPLKNDNLIFKDFKEEYFKKDFNTIDGDKIIFSKEILNEEIDDNWKNKILGSCLILLNVSRIKILKEFHYFPQAFNI